uniref:Pantoate--beta-alanine ligase n=1 Tax=Albugo laibachii Nc14 TaxID=890382 RepID=F0WRP8_9STRA|nr:pantoate betaalanine ligase putative [Albugo laibachii Nc14]|eukprot:CCA24012.1 pantoate betaalanine ligase putative [Albugo laibachii Nc14]
MSRFRVQPLQTIRSFRKARQSLSPQSTLGFIPTMGGLHQGHLDLIRRARSECDTIAVSIFVNPLQFGPKEDFGRYPRTLEADVALLESEKVDLLFTPSMKEMISSSSRFAVEPRGFESLAEAKMRPGHFEGVAMILIKLFNIVRPTHAYFGQKDAAQCVLVRHLIDDFHFGITPKFVPVSREANGLARSTRNKYLSEEARRKAGVISRGLDRAKIAFQTARNISAQKIEQLIREEFATEPLLTEIEYISIASLDAMTPIEHNEMRQTHAFCRFQHYP